MLSRAEVAALPLACCLVDTDGAELARTAEFAGRAGSTIALRHGELTLLVADEDLDATVGAAASRLAEVTCAAVETAAGSAASTVGERLRVLAGSLRVSAGLGPGVDGTTGDVARLLEAAAEARSSASLRLGPWADGPVPGPAACAGALLQLVVNAADHGGAEVVDISASAQCGTVCFEVSWPGQPPAQSALVASRRQDRAPRTGLAAVRAYADAAGGSLSGLQAVEGGRRTRVQLDIGEPVLALAAARVEDGVPVWTTRAFTEETGCTPGSRLPDDVAVAAFRAVAGRGISAAGAWRARAGASGTVVALQPQGRAEAAVLAARVLEHERALMRCLPADQSRVRALAHLLMWSLGRPLPTVTGAVFRRDAPREFAARGLPMPEIADLDTARAPLPPVVAHLVAEYGGAVAVRGEQVVLDLVTPADDPLRPLLGPPGQPVLLASLPPPRAGGCQPE